MGSSPSQGHLPAMTPVPPAKEPTVVSSALVGGKGADTHGCAMGMDQRSSDGAVHPLQGCRLESHSPVSPDKGHQLTLGSRSSAGFQ